MQKRLKRVAIKSIDPGLCSGCQLCVDSCMMDVIYFDTAANAAQVRYPEDCQACFLCARDCPTGAITIA